MRLRNLLLALLFCFVASAGFSQQMTNITATKLLNVDGTAVTGRLCVTPTQVFTFGGGGQGTTVQKCFTATAGVLQSSALVADTSATTPANLCISAALYNSSLPASQNPVRSWSCLQPSGSRWSLDGQLPIGANSPAVINAGVINQGTANQLVFYNGNGTNLSGMAPSAALPQILPGATVTGSGTSQVVTLPGAFNVPKVSANAVVIPSQSAASFSIVAFPDIQNMTDYGSACGVSGTPSQFNAMTAWVVANQSAYNIVAVAGEGDNVNFGGASPGWANAATGWATILNSGLPMVSAIGNHDYDTVSSSCTGAPTSRVATNFLANFGPSVLSGKSYYGGYYSTGDTTEAVNQWVKFTVGTQQYGLIGLEFCPRNEAMTWAMGVMSANPTTEFIVVTHSYLNDLGVLSPASYSGGGCGLYWSTDYNDSPAMWSTLQDAPNLFMILNGHYYNANTNSINGASLVQIGSQGNSVDAMFINDQNENPNTGTLRLITVYPSLGYLSTQTIATSPSATRTDPSNQFTMPIYGASISGSSSAGATQGSSVIHATQIVQSDGLVQGVSVIATGTGAFGALDSAAQGAGAQSSSVLNRDGTFSLTTNFGESGVSGTAYTGENYVTGYSNSGTGSGTGSAPSIIGRAANGTQAYPAVIHNGQPIFVLGGRPWDGTTASFNGAEPSPASIMAVANGDTSTSNHGAYWNFLTTPGGSTTRYSSVTLFTYDLEVGPTTLPFNTSMSSSDVAVNAPNIAEFYYNVTGSPTNETIWRTVEGNRTAGNCVSGHSCWQLEAMNDAATTEQAAIEVTRNLNTITGIYLDGPVAAPSVTLNGNKFSNSPEIPWTAQYLWTVPLTAANRNVGASITPRYAITFTDIDIAFNTLATCSTPQQVQLYDETSASAVGPTATLASGSGIQHYAFSYAATPAHTYVLETAVAATCTTDPIVNITLQYQMQ